MDSALRTAKRQLDNHEVSVFYYLELLKRAGQFNLATNTNQYIIKPQTVAYAPVGSGTHELIWEGILWLYNNNLANTILIVSPAALMPNLLSQLESLNLHYSMAKTTTAAGFNLCSYDALYKLDRSQTGPINLIWCTEAHYIKNALTNRYKALCRLSLKSNPIWKIASTGGLFYKNRRDIWGLYGVCNWLDSNLAVTIKEKAAKTNCDIKDVLEIMKPVFAGLPDES